jgi:DNA segregation ATPase FtsK/SpoIIIE-like protein
MKITKIFLAVLSLYVSGIVFADSYSTAPQNSGQQPPPPQQQMQQPQQQQMQQPQQQAQAQQQPAPPSPQCNVNQVTDPRVPPAGSYVVKNGDGSSNDVYTTGDKKPYYVDNPCANGGSGGTSLPPQVFVQPNVAPR